MKLKSNCYGLTEVTSSRVKMVVFSTLFCILSSNVTAQEFGLCPSPPSQDLVGADEVPDIQNPLDLLNKINFGAALGVSLLGHPNIANVSAEPIQLEEGETQFIARIDREEQFRRELWLESHYLLDYTCVWQRPIAHGPFVALNLLNGDGGILNAFALGYLLSFKQSADPEDNSALNIGIGIQNSSVTVLGDGVVANQPLPEGVENVRTKEIDSFGLVLLVSFTFFAP